MGRKRSGKRSISVQNNDEITERQEGADIQFKDDVAPVRKYDHEHS